MIAISNKRACIQKLKYVAERGPKFPAWHTGKYMGALPVGVSFNCGQVRGSTYVRWTAGYI